MSEPQVRLVFIPHDPTLWTQGDETSRHECSWHAQANKPCSDKPVWAVQMPKGDWWGVCEAAAHEVLRHYAKRLPDRTSTEP